MRYLKTIFILLLSFSFAKAQFVSADSKRVADVYFLNKEYYAAAEYYKKALQISPDSLGFVVPYGFEKKVLEESPKKEDYEYAVFQLATSLRLYKNFQDAEKWYAIANNFTNSKYALSGFWYGDCLRSNLRFEEAIMAYEIFIKKYPINDSYKEKAIAEIESCKFALNEIKYPRLYKLAKLPANVNLSGSNYATALLNNTFYFTSSRPKMVAGKNEVLAGVNENKVVKKATPYINAIYTAQVNTDTAKVNVSKVAVNAREMEVAAPALHPNGNAMYFTAWTNKDEKIRSIYISRKSATGEWSDPISLGGEINVNGYNSMQPYVTKDGKYFVFSSDRPGGSGKYDLWYALVRPDGTTGNAMNLGEKINSKGDDQAPYFNPKTKKLMFSTNGRVGMGGFDFYEAQGDFTNWTAPKNLGYPFNSAKDDLYFTSLDDQDNEGYVSSDRESVCCLEIFHVKKDILTVSGKLIDCESKKPLEGAKVVLTSDDLGEMTTTTDANGNYSFGITSNRGFHLNATKRLYFAKNLNYSLQQLVAIDTLKGELCLDKIPEKPIVLKNILYEFDSAELTDSSKVNLNHLYDIMVENKDIEIELGAHTDNIGTAEYNLDLSQRRAKSCVDYLISKGIAPERMTSKGYGFDVPIAPNQLAKGKDNPEGRALNRRTEFKVTKK
ncbi:OmpA family protein [Pedobacter frigiditerrae]|uniref:OmpA family protein n=1 Tax=Pedobacter frigiditerrae TaxID=2530452 RepID=UPI002931C785|nr:OmpA family protein [Pedobacter frigiditerrae]